MELEDRLTNWARYVRSPRTLGAPAKPASLSIEAGYSNPQGKGCPTGWGDYGITMLGSIKDTFDRQDAEIIEKIVCRLGANHTLLTFHYVYRADPRATARKLKFHIMEYDTMLDIARNLVRIRLQSVSGSPTIQYRASVPNATGQA